ncbi:hypothetical protein ACFSR6_03885 [Pedobacter vanadiisoli]|uniref:Uncharacterized protein n=1 Tax=Pedobacter vanadiisoli TaxID=1761975 RepID=A0ABW5MEF5_9SPHI
MKKVILISLSLFTGKLLFAQNTFPTSGNVGIGTLNPTSWFGGTVQQIEGRRAVLRLAPSLSGDLGTILFKGAFSEGVTSSEDEFHLNYVSNPADPYLALGAYKNGHKTILSLKGVGHVGIGTETPNSTLTVRSASTGVSIHPGASPYFGTLAFNRESGTGAIFDPSGKAFQINNGGGDQNLHIQVYNGDGTLVTNNSLVISGANGNVGIGTANLTDALTVAGKIGAREIKVSTNAGADFVFDPDYNLPDLTELEQFVKTNKHLPEIPTAQQMVENGVNLGELNIKLLQKVEELTLHLIEKEKQLRNQENKVIQLESKLTQQEKTIQEILKKIK